MTHVRSGYKSLTMPNCSNHGRAVLVFRHVHHYSQDVCAQCRSIHKRLLMSAEHLDLSALPDGPALVQHVVQKARREGGSSQLSWLLTCLVLTAASTQMVQNHRCFPYSAAAPACLWSAVQGLDCLGKLWVVSLLGHIVPDSCSCRHKPVLISCLHACPR